MMYHVYLLRHTLRNRTYIGFTTNPKRRIRQHNGEIKGGAKYTRKGTWKYVAIISGFKNKRSALQFEWAAKHKTHGIQRRCKKLCELFCQEQWTQQADPTCTQPPLTVSWYEAFDHQPFQGQYKCQVNHVSVIN